METAKCTQNSTESFKLEDLPFFVVYVLCNVKEGMENSISREEKDNSQRSSKVFNVNKKQYSVGVVTLQLLTKIHVLQYYRLQVQDL